MQNIIIQFPKQSEYGKMLAKSKVFANADISKATKEVFKTVTKMIWVNKLSPSTVNLPEKGWILEIQVISIYLNDLKYMYDVMRAIDKAIRHPVLFQLFYEEKLKYSMAYKRQSEADNSKWVIGDYYESGWVDTAADKASMPVALNLESLYYSFLKLFLPLNVRDGETTIDTLKRAERLKQKQKEAEVLTTKLNREKQFNRQIEINRELRLLKAEIEELVR